ncbi:MAG: hypothetical protein AAGH79_10285 [Bacteroidota bacterium]
MQLLSLGLGFVLIIPCLACTESTDNKARPTVSAVQVDTLSWPSSLDDYATPQDTLLTYAELRHDINTQVEQIRNQAVPEDSLSVLFQEILLHRILPRWAGTPWSFEGHISEPETGSIACGYFVSTTLNHLGLPLNRYHLAQQSPSNEARSLALGDRVLTFEGESTEAITRAMQDSLATGIYFIGLAEGHVGFLLVEDQAFYLIHSNYLGDQGVEMERLADSEVFSSYRQFKIVPLNTNQELLNRWKNGKVIPIFRE